MKAVLDKKNQESLGGHTGPVPVEVTVVSDPSTEPEHYLFTAAAVGQYQGMNLPHAKESPYDDQSAGKRGKDRLFKSSDDDDDDSGESEDEDESE